MSFLTGWVALSPGVMGMFSRAAHPMVSHRLEDLLAQTVGNLDEATYHEQTSRLLPYFGINNLLF